MNPNRLTREIRKIPGNIRSPKLPGGTLISAVLDRKLMGWSDRGGASRIFGDVWSEHCWYVLSNGARIFEHQSYDHTTSQVIRLDDIPEIAIQAGRNKLPNPDFLILSPESDGTYSVRAVDAKFAVDRLKRTQISPNSIRELIELPKSLARVAIEQRVGSVTGDHLSYREGLFLGPSSLLNDYFYRELTSGENPKIPADELQLVSVKSDSLFDSVEDRPVMEQLKQIDGLQVDNDAGRLVLDMYYLRLATAARWFESQEQAPLLSNEQMEPIAVDTIMRATVERVEPGESAYGLIEQWAQVTDQVLERQKQVREAARLPVRMSELRKLLEREGIEPENRTIRKTRGILERRFMDRLIEETGSIPNVPENRIGSVVQLVKTTSRSLREEMQSEAIRVVTQVVVPEAEREQSEESS